MDASERELVRIELMNHNKLREGYRSRQAQLASFIVSNLTDSSVKRLKDVARVDFEQAVLKNDIVVLLDRIRLAHIYCGHTAANHSRRRFQLQVDFS
jgi:hypothetical protein